MTLCFGSLDLIVCGIIITVLNVKLGGLIYTKWGDSQKLTVQGQSIRQREMPPEAGVQVLRITL